ncbi:nitrite reductase/ring-hydroxylating ferredoxin subunit [Kineococcus xinjiangensis]|uniref:Nitrite reductase/ring-hydroxylating ferredoxin subunit n=1 Tax=Kineococcus xinjiangensis TaxID=512762 RepID=A0A2S6IT79_9ACTN|nr:Rieske (2Fe-2S) protein [Kineococcus xinjiangensis]PPK97438.1 nitrite reductase/ring-hydroxylating ferredoxin subunit [Kineococcus xinjiangensis]
MDRLTELTALDPVAERLSDLVHSTIPAPVRDLLHGVPLGHPAHPAMAMLPAGAWLSSAVLDLADVVSPSRSRASAAALLAGVGVAAALPTALAGLVDWSDLHSDQKRMGLVHAAANEVAVALVSVGVVRHLRGRGGRRWRLAGTAAASLGALIGGHLATRWAVGANHAEDVPHRAPKDWEPLLPLAELVEGEPVRGRCGDVDVVMVRRGGNAVSVLADRCSHLGAPLSEGSVEQVRGRDCIVCPWHGSAFELEAGSVVRGPAIAHQPRFDTRVVDGVVQARIVTVPGA